VYSGKTKSSSNLPSFGCKVFPTLPASTPPVEDAPHRSSETVTGTTNVDSETLPGSIGEVAEVGRGGTAPVRSCVETSTLGFQTPWGWRLVDPPKILLKKSFSAGMTGRLGQQTIDISLCHAL